MKNDAENVRVGLLGICGVYAGAAILADKAPIVIGRDPVSYTHLEQEMEAGSVVQKGETLIFYVSGENSTGKETVQMEESIEEQEMDNNQREENELLQKAAESESTVTETESVIESEDQSTWIAEVEETGGHRSQEAQHLLNYICLLYTSRCV